MAQFMQKPTNEHWTLVKCILRYLCGTLDKGLLLYRDLPLTLHGFADSFHAFSDADWAGIKTITLQPVPILFTLGVTLYLGAQRSSKQLLARPPK